MKISAVARKLSNVFISMMPSIFALIAQFISFLHTATLDPDAFIAKAQLLPASPYPQIITSFPAIIATVALI